MAETGKAAGGRAEMWGLYGGVPSEWLDRGESLADYGVNAVWIGSGSLDAASIARLKGENAAVFAEFNTMHAAEYLTVHPGAAPIGADGEICPPPDGWQGVCPTHFGYRTSRMDAFRQTLREFEIDGIWLDYHHSHASWEQAEPNLPDTCFCPRCVGHFTLQTGLTPPSGSGREAAAWLLGEQRGAWTAWRCSVFTDWVREFRAILDAERPGALLGTFHCPWSAEERGGALREKLAIDLERQARYLDVFSPMGYHVRFGHAADTGWISRQVAALGSCLGIRGELGERKRIWPIVQVADWGERVPVAQVEAVLAEGIRPPATGVMVFAWHGIRADTAKQQAIGRFYRERAGR